MRNIFILIFIITSTLISTDATSQTIEKMSLRLNSLSNESVKVNVELDNVNDRITFKLNSKEKLCINGYRDLIENIKNLDKKFIAVHYIIRGGTGIKMRMTALVCISKGKLYKALDVLSTESYVFKKTYDKATDSLGLYDESGLYTLEFNLRNNKQNFQLSAIQYEKVKSKYDKNENYEKTDTIKFYFDEKNKVFYTKYISLKGNYKIESEGVKNEQRVFKGEKYPLINLRYEYIFIDKVWYYKMPGNLLEEISGSCE